MISENYKVEVDRLSDREWNENLRNFEDMHYEQVASQNAHASGHASHLILRDFNEKIVAGARLAIYELPRLGRGLALVRFGPLWRRRGQPAFPDIYRATVTALVEEYCKGRGHSLIIRPRPNPDFYADESRMLGELGFVVRRRLPAPDRYCADVSLDEEEQLKNFDQKWRYNLKQAQKNGFDIRFDDTEAGIVAFRHLHDDMTARKSLDSAARGMIDSLDDLARLPDPIQMRVVLVRHHGEPIAGATIGILGDAAFYVLGATNKTALKLKAGYAMQWWIVRWLRGQNVRWYELGGTGDTGIRQFKKGLIGKRGVVLETAEYDRWASISGRLAADVIYLIRDARNFVTKWYG